MWNSTVEWQASWAQLTARLFLPTIEGQWSSYFANYKGVRSYNVSCNILLLISRDTPLGVLLRCSNLSPRSITDTLDCRREAAVRWSSVLWEGEPTWHHPGFLLHRKSIIGPFRCSIMQVQSRFQQNRLDCLWRKLILAGGQPSC